MSDVGNDVKSPFAIPSFHIHVSQFHPDLE